MDESGKFGDIAVLAGTERETQFFDVGKCRYQNVSDSPLAILTFDLTIMLILSRRESECIHLGDDIVLTIVRVSGEKVRIGVQAPPHVKILRNELDISVGNDLNRPESQSASEPATQTQSPSVAPISAKTDAIVRKVPIQVRRAA